MILLKVLSFLLYWGRCQKRYKEHHPINKINWHRSLLWQWIVYITSVNSQPDKHRFRGQAKQPHHQNKGQYNPQEQLRQQCGISQIYNLLLLQFVHYSDVCNSDPTYVYNCLSCNLARNKTKFGGTNWEQLLENALL